MKSAIFVLSDPKTGGDEALGRVFNALATAYEYKQAGEDVTALHVPQQFRYRGGPPAGSSGSACLCMRPLLTH
jgi:hypothetical protein